MIIQAEQKISMREKVGYSFGDVSANLVFQMLMVYQLKFYTDIFGLDGAVAGSVLLFAPLLCAFIDPLAGIIADRTNSRWGKYRPWLLWTAVPFSVFYFLTFYNPGIEDKVMVAAYATVSYLLLLAAYGFNNTPYASLGGVMTGDIAERTSINKVRFMAAAVAQLVVQGLTLPLVNHFGQGDAELGWARTILLFAIFVCVFSIIAFLSTSERIHPPRQQRMSIRQDVGETFMSKPWRSMFFLTLVMFTGVAMWSSSINFYFQDYLDADSLTVFLNRIGFSVTSDKAYSVGFSLFNTVNSLVQVAGILFLSSYLANHFGKRTIFMVGLVLTMVFTALFYIISPHDVWLAYLFCFLKSLAYAPTIPLLWAMVADSADYIEYIHHRRATGFCFSGIVFALKCGMGIGAALAGLFLSGFGYEPGGAGVQPQHAIQGIRLMSSVVPALLFCGAIMALYHYPISQVFNQKMQAELKSRRKFEQ